MHNQQPTPELTGKAHAHAHGLVGAPAPNASANDTFAAFHRLVLEDAELFALLHQAPTTDAFVALAVELGAARGLVFGTGDVRAALQAARRAWIERALP